jgi:hypothetical protein
MPPATIDNKALRLNMTFLPCFVCQLPKCPPYPGGAEGWATCRDLPSSLSQFQTCRRRLDGSSDHDVEGNHYAVFVRSALAGVSTACKRKPGHIINLPFSAATTNLFEL